MSEAVAYLQAGLGKSHQGTAADDHELQVFEMYDMISMDAEEEVEINAVGDVSEAVTLKEVKQAQADNPFAADMMEYVTTGELPKNKAKAKTVATHAHVYGVIEGALVRTARSKHGLYEARAQRYVPKSGNLGSRIVDWYHTELAHAGTLRTAMHIAEQFYWPSVLADVYSQVRSCAQKQFFAAKQPAAPVVGHVTASYPGQKYAMDIMHLTPRTAVKTKLKHKAGKAKQQKQGKTAGGEQYALTAVDVFSRKGFLIPIDDLETATVETAIRRGVVVRGVPAEFIFDGGSEFKAQVKAGAAACGARTRAPNNTESQQVTEHSRKVQQDDPEDAGTCDRQFRDRLAGCIS